MRIRVLTINLHKGFSPLNRRFVLPELSRGIRSLGADIVFLQEVIGENTGRISRRHDWPGKPQHEYIAAESGYSHVYGRNVVHAFGHHGNAIITRYPIVFSEHIDISTNRFEKRGLLYARLKLPGRAGELHCICTHLGLLPGSRKKQFTRLRKYIQEMVPEKEPLIVGGDFNEWRIKRDELEINLLMKDVGLELHGRKLRTFPSLLPIFPLDRIYARGFKTLEARVVRKGPCARLSDHAGFIAELERTVK